MRENLRSNSGLPTCFEFPVFLLFVDSGNWKIRWGMFRYEAIVWFTLTCNTQGMGMSSPDLAQKASISPFLKSHENQANYQSSSQVKSGKHTISCRLARSRRKKLSNVQCNTLHDVYIDCSHCAVHACQLPMCQLKTPKSRWCRLVINPNRQRGINITMQKGIQVANGRALCSSKKSLFLTFEFWFLVGLTNSRKKSK